MILSNIINIRCRTVVSTSFSFRNDLFEQTEYLLFPHTFMKQTAEKSEMLFSPAPVCSCAT